MPLETLFKKINNEEKRLRLFLEDTLKNLGAGEKETAHLYLGILKIIEEQNRLIKQLHVEIEDRLSIQAEETELVRNLIGTSESAARFRASKFARQIVILKERLYEKQKLSERVEELEKEKNNMELMLAELKDKYSEKFNNHFLEIEEEKKILQGAFLEMGIKQEHLAKELAAQKNVLVKEMDDVRKQYFDEFLETFQDIRVKEAMTAEYVITDYIFKIRNDIKNIVRHTENCVENLDLRKIDANLRIERTPAGKIKLYFKKLKQAYSFMDVLIKRQYDAVMDFKHIAEILKTLDNQSQIYMGLIKPAQTNIVKIKPVELRDRAENIFYNFSTNRQVTIIFNIDLSLPSLILDVNSLDLALKEIFINGTDAASGTGEIDVQLHYDGEKNKFILDISNDGKPVSPRMRFELFKPFVTDKQGREGLGLVRAKIACQRMGGDLILKESTEEKTTFQITLPALIRVSKVRS